MSSKRLATSEAMAKRRINGKLPQHHDWWSVDQVQFVRLLSEINAVGLERETRELIATSMSLTTTELKSLLRRAEKIWNEWIQSGLFKLQYPLSSEVQTRQLSEFGRIEGIVGVPFADTNMEFRDEESFLSMLSASLSGENGLSAIRYTPLFVGGTNVYFLMSGIPLGRNPDIPMAH